MNSRITPRERGLIKGAIRRAFARSDLRRQIVEENLLKGYSDASRPRVKFWGKCLECQTPTPKSYLVVDHKAPVIPIHTSFEDMSLDEVVDRMWCLPDNLQILCEKCHLIKTKEENKIRRAKKKEKKNEGHQTAERSNKTVITRNSNKRASSRSRKKITKIGKRSTTRTRKKT